MSQIPYDREMSAKLAGALAEMAPSISRTDMENLEMLYSSQDGLPHRWDDSNRPQGPTIGTCRKIGSELKRRLGFGPKYGMSVCGYSENDHWRIQADFAAALSSLGWFAEREVPTERRLAGVVKPVHVWEERFEGEVEELLRKPLSRPAGCPEPEVRIGLTSYVVRDPLVHAWVLRQANGICDCCQRPGPFLASDGRYFLEVHHLIRLADRGPDTPENAVAVCPNCHRELHLGKRAKSLREAMYRRIERLVAR
jgi:hypothetical protein